MNKNRKISDDKVVVNNNFKIDCQKNNYSATDKFSESVNKSSDVSINASTKVFTFKNSILASTYDPYESKIISPNNISNIDNISESTFCVLCWQDGTMYKGNTKNLQLTGKGKFTHASGFVLDGNFTKGKLNGNGIYKGPDNKKTFEGNWSEGLPSGYGVEIDQDHYTYEGEFREGTRHGKGKLKYKNKGEYEGEFDSNHMEGIGIFTWENGKKYAGSWFRSKMEGKGTMKWPDGRMYTGEYSNGKKNGCGTFFFSDGRKYVGVWTDGYQNGDGVYSDLRGNEIYATWNNGQIEYRDM